MPSPPDFPVDRIPEPGLKAKYARFESLLAGYGPSAVAFSGGVDSAFLAAVARRVLGRDGAKAFIAVSPSLAKRELREALDLARSLDLDLRAYDSTEFDNPAYLANGPDRCFHCKDDLFLHLRGFADALGLRTLLYGGNLDDQADYRPGRRAADLRGALAPMAEAGLAKADIRALSKLFGLPTHDKPAMPCLSSRIPYGLPVTPAKLSMVEAGEESLRAMGFRDYRVRHEGDTARVEVPVDQFGLFADAQATGELVESLRVRGFKRVVVDLEGFRSGNLNRDLPEAVRARGTAAPAPAAPGDLSPGNSKGTRAPGP